MRLNDNQLMTSSWFSLSRGLKGSLSRPTLKNPIWLSIQNGVLNTSSHPVTSSHLKLSHSILLEIFHFKISF